MPPAALSQAGRAGPDEPTRAIPAGRPDVRDRRQRDRRQTRIIAECPRLGGGDITKRQHNTTASFEMLELLVLMF